MRFLQDRPHPLELAYDLANRMLRPWKRWLRPSSPAEKLFIPLEKVGKGLLFDCRMCGQCTLHLSGMTCPMTCPKELRNGPCGGVRPDGNCEIIPSMRCVWVEAWERAQKMPRYGHHILELVPPLDHRLQGTSAWVNQFSANHNPPAGWEG
jgi:hypothetical protein